MGASGAPELSSYPSTLALLVGVGLGTLGLGVTLAWLVVFPSFPGAAPSNGRSPLPLALPAYVIGFVFLGMFEFASPLQAALRGSSARVVFPTYARVGASSS